MKLWSPIGIGVALLAGQLSAFSAEVATLQNGFSIHFQRKEQIGQMTRLYLNGGFIDIATAEIASFEHDDTPDAPALTPAIQNPAPAVQNVAAAAVTTNTVKPTPQVDLNQVVRDAGSRYQLDPDFIASVIKAESNFQNRAVSRKGAQGLMQLMPETASKLGVTDPFDPKANVEGGTAYLNQLLNLYHDDPIKALAAYNAGAHRVEQYHGVPPYAETRAYVARIVRDFNAKKRAQMKATAQPATAKSANKAPKKKPHAAQPQEAAVSKSNKPA